MNHPTPARRAARTAAAVSVAAAAALGLAACNGSSDDPTTTTSTSATTPSTTTSTTVTQTPSTPATTSTGVPDAAKQKTAAGAQAFATFFWVRLNRAHTLPDERQLAPYCLPDSKSCEALKETARTLKANKQRYAADPLTITGLTGARMTGDSAVLDYSAIQNRVNILNADGSVDSTDPRELFDTQLALRWQDGSWAVESIKSVVR